MSMFAVPVIAALASWLHYAERPVGIELVGIVSIAISLLILSIAAIRQQRGIVGLAAR